MIQPKTYSLVLILILYCIWYATDLSLQRGLWGNAASQSGYGMPWPDGDASLKMFHLKNWPSPGHFYEVSLASCQNHLKPHMMHSKITFDGIPRMTWMINFWGDLHILTTHPDANWVFQAHVNEVKCLNIGLDRWARWVWWGQWPNAGPVRSTAGNNQLSKKCPE